MSPSWTRNHHHQKTLQRSSIWGRCPAEVRPTYSGAWAGVLLGRADSHMRLRRGVWLPTRALCRKLQVVGGVARPPYWHAWLVGGVGGHPSCRWCMEACLEGTSFLPRFPGWGAKSSGSSMTILPPAQNAWIGRHSCWFQTPRCPAKTAGRDNTRRPCLMPRPFSIGLRKPTHQVLAKGTFWQDVTRS